MTLSLKKRINNVRFNKTISKRDFGKAKALTNKLRKSKSLSRVYSVKYRKCKDCKLEDDFYTHVNYTWMKTHILPKDKASTNAFVLTQKKVDNELLNLVEKKLIHDKNPDAKRCLALYESTINWNNDLVMSQIYLHIEELNNLRKEEDGLYKLLAWLLRNGISCPFEFGISADPKNSHTYVGIITEAGLSFLTKDMYFKNDKVSRNIRKQYINFLTMLFAEVFGKNNSYNVNKILEIETELAKHIYKANEKHDLDKIYNKFGERAAKTACNFDLTTFSKEIGFSSAPEYIIIENPAFIKNAMLLLNKSWNSNDWNTYWVCQILFIASKYNKSLYNINFGFFGMFMEGIKTPPKKKLRATAKVQNIMNTTLSKKYLEYYRNKKQKEFCENLIEKMRNKFRERLQKNSWLNKKTVDMAIEKLDKMNMVVGYKNKWEEDPDCVFLPNDAWSNYKMYSTWILNKIVGECGKKIPASNVWQRTDEMNVYDVNAFYNNLLNELIIPNAFLQAPFIDLDKNIAYNMAYIGTTIGHELTHAFDDYGCKYNGSGLYKNWWLKEDTIEYKKKQKMIIDQYEYVAKKDKVKLQGSLTLGENIADIGGFILAEETLEEILNESCIVGKAQDAYFKEFYYEYAKQWRSVMRKQLLKKSLNHDVHSVSKYRVNCVLMRSARFKRIFNITPADGMWFENNDTIW